MGIVTNYLRNPIVKQVDDNGVVVWYDPDRHYTGIASYLEIPNTTITRYKNSFFAPYATKLNLSWAT